MHLLTTGRGRGDCASVDYRLGGGNYATVYYMVGWG